jgi:hypothetical protein
MVPRPKYVEALVFGIARRFTHLRRVIASTPSAPDEAVFIWRAQPRAHRFQISLVSRYTAMLAGLRILIQTRQGPDR